MTKIAKRRVVATEAGDQTKEKILVAAERLFAAGGFDGVSMRDVGNAADVPFALITYHFETKLGLYKAVFRRRKGVIADTRLERLRLIRITGNAQNDLSQIAQAVIEPLVALRDQADGLDVARLLTREAFDPLESERGIIAESLDPTARVVIGLLQLAAPNASYEQICWAFYFASGAMSIHGVNSGRLERLSSGKCQTSDTTELAIELTRFVSAAWMGVLAHKHSGSA